MNEHDIIVQIINEIEAATSGVDVRTEGGDQEITPPEVIISYDPIRLPNQNGHNSFGAVIEDGQTGYHVGVEHHAYFRMDAVLTVRTYDERERNDLVTTLQEAFIPYETDAVKFNRDTTEWNVDTNRARVNALLEPDWYEGGVTLRFKYIKRVTDLDHDTIEEITNDVQNDEDLIKITTELK